MNRVPEAAKNNYTVRCLWILKLISEDNLHLSELAILMGCSERAIQRLLQAGSTFLPASVADPGFHSGRAPRAHSRSSASLSCSG